MKLVKLLLIILTTVLMGCTRVLTIDNTSEIQPKKYRGVYLIDTLDDDEFD